MEARLNKTQVKVLDFIKSKADERGECYLRPREIAEGVGLSLVYVRQVTSQLKRHGVMQVVPMCEWKAWDRYCEEEDPPRPPVVTVEEANYENEYWPGRGEYRRGGNLYKIMTATHADRTRAVDTLC